MVPVPSNPGCQGIFHCVDRRPRLLTALGRPHLTPISGVQGDSILF